MAADLDVARPVSAQIIEAVESKLHDLDDSRELLILLEIAGSGKTTILSRCAFELARRGIATLRCTSLSRLEPSNTTKTLNAIPGPLVIVVDNFADQVTSFQTILDTIEKKDVVVLAGERSYRTKYITQALSGLEFRLFVRARLGKDEVSQLPTQLHQVWCSWRRERHFGASKVRLRGNERSYSCSMLPHTK